MTFSETIRKWRKSRKISQSEAGASLGVSVRTIQHWEQGDYVPSELTRRLLADSIKLPNRRKAA